MGVCMYDSYAYLSHQGSDRADGGGPEQRVHDDEDHRGDGRDHRAEPVQVDEEPLCRTGVGQVRAG